MNRIEIIGHIGQNAEIKDLGANQVINFSVAVSESYIKNNEKVQLTTWFECAKWGNQTAIAQFLKKGTQVFVSGKPNNRGWLNDQGEVKVVNGINVMSIELLGSKNNDSETQNTPQPTPQANQSNSFADTPKVDSEEHDDLPF